MLFASLSSVFKLKKKIKMCLNQLGAQYLSKFKSNMFRMFLLYTYSFVF